MDNLKNEEEKNSTKNNKFLINNENNNNNKSNSLSQSVSGSNSYNEKDDQILKLKTNLIS